MKSVLLLFLMALVVVDAELGKLSPQENDDTQEACGKKAHYQRKVINGELVKKEDHPWAVSVYVRHFNETAKKFSTLLGPGTLISSRHIIAFNTIKHSESGTLNVIGLEDTGLNGTCEGDHMVLPKVLLSRFDVDLEYMKEFNGSREFKPTIAKVTVMYGCKSLTPSSPMILELAAPMENDTVPVCLSNSPDNWDDVAGFSVYGINKTGLMVSGRFGPVDCTSKAPFSCAEALNKASQGLCQGDFGGSAIARIDHRHTVLGIYASGNTRCSAKTEKLAPSHFVNLGYYRQEICDITGVCVPPPPTSAPTFATLGRLDIPETFPHFTHFPKHQATTSAPETTTEDYPIETTNPYDHTDYETDAPYFEAGEKIVAETYAPMKIQISNCSDGEVIKAERIDPMAVGEGGSTRGDRQGDINIHIYLHQ